MNHAVVIAVSISKQHTFSKSNQTSIRLLTGLSVEGDAHLGNQAVIKRYTQSTSSCVPLRLDAAKQTASACGQPTGNWSLGLPLGILWLGDRFGWLSLSAVLNTTLSPGFLIFNSTLVLFWLGAKTKPRYLDFCCDFHTSSKTQRD